MDGESVALEEVEALASSDTEAFAEFDRLLDGVVEAELWAVDVKEFVLEAVDESWAECVDVSVGFTVDV